MASVEGAPILRLAVVDDSELVIHGVATMLDPYADRVRLVEIGSGVPMARDVDVILVDVFGSQGSRADDIAPLLATGAKVVGYSFRLHPTAIALALARGVDGYLSKALSAADLVRALSAIRDGETIISPPRADGLESEWPGDDAGLSPREAETVALIVHGLTNQQIADETFLSINTIKTIIRTAYEKMDVTTRSQAVAWGMNNGFETDSQEGSTPVA